MPAPKTILKTAAIALAAVAIAYRVTPVRNVIFPTGSSSVMI